MPASSFREDRIFEGLLPEKLLTLLIGPPLTNCFASTGPVCVHPRLIPLALFFPSLFDAELEATEACRWLRATGFPQYAQMYEGK